MRRDGDQSGDDTVSIVLDTYGDHRTGYFFQINAAGARVDGLIDDPQNISPVHLLHHGQDATPWNRGNEQPHMPDKYVRAASRNTG
jgi:hypothetical protein